MFVGGCPRHRGPLTDFRINESSSFHQATPLSFSFSDIYVYFRQKYAIYLIYLPKIHTCITICVYITIHLSKYEQFPVVFIRQTHFHSFSDMCVYFRQKYEHFSVDFQYVVNTVSLLLCVIHNLFMTWCLSPALK